MSGTEGYVDKDEESTERKPARGAPKEIFTQTGDSMEGSNAGDDGSEAGSKVKGSQSEEIVSQGKYYYVTNVMTCQLHIISQGPS